MSSTNQSRVEVASASNQTCLSPAHAQPKRQRMSSTPPTEDVFGGPRSRKHEIDNPTESNLSRAERVRRARAQEYTLQEQAGSGHAEFHLYPKGRILHQEETVLSFLRCLANVLQNLAVPVEHEGQKQLRTVEDPCKHTPLVSMPELGLA